jgi:hypothetical protein
MIESFYIGSSSSNRSQIIQETFTGVFKQLSQFNDPIWKCGRSRIKRGGYGTRSTEYVEERIFSNC